MGGINTRPRNQKILDKDLGLWYNSKIGGEMKDNKACAQCKYRIQEDEVERCEIGYRQFPSSKKAIENSFKNYSEVCHFISAVYLHDRGENDIHE